MKRHAFGFIVFFCLIYGLFAQNNAPTSAHSPSNSHRIIIPLTGAWTAVLDDNERLEVINPATVSASKKLLFQNSFFIPDSLRYHKFVLHINEIRPSSSIHINDKFVFNSSPAVNFVDAVLNHEYINFNATNQLAIEIETTLDNRSSLPFKHRPRGWNPVTGLLGAAYIEVLPAINIELKSWQYQFSKAYSEVDLAMELAVNKVLNGTNESQLPGTVELTVEILKNEKVVHKAVRTKINLDSLHRQIKQVKLTASGILPWSPSTPELYDVRIQIQSKNKIYDAIQQQIGFREVKIDGKNFFLNGEKFIVKGIDYIDDLAGLNAEQRKAKLAEIMHNIKKLGMNTIRVVGSPLQTDFLRQCALNGIFVLEEIPLYYANATQLQNQKIASDIEIGLQTLLRRDNTETAILGWGIGVNIADASSAAASFVTSTMALVRKLDARPVYIVTRSKDKNPALDAVDFLLFDMFEKDSIALGTDLMPDKPVLPVLGYFIKPYLVADDYIQKQRRWLEAEEIQAEQMESALRMLRESDEFAGSFIHALQDWRGEYASIIVGTVQDDRQNFPGGLLGSAGETRVSFEMVASYNNGDRRPNISTTVVHTDGTTVFALIGGIVILLFLFFWKRDRRLHTTLRRIFMHPHGFYTDLNENRKVPAFITVIVAIAQSAILALLIGSTLYSCREILLFDEILNLLIPSPQLKVWAIDLIWHPGWLILIFVIIYIVSVLFLSVLFRILGFFFGRTLPLGQYTTFLFWAATCYLPLALVTPVFYRILLAENGIGISIAVAAFFILWHLLRIYRGMRVLLVLPPGRAFILFLTVLFIIFGSIAFYYNQTQAIFGYVDYYWTLLN
ncbi:MAG: hypothetical protein DWQ10_00645 [Calditrichaeota bacterium]|nr:MAG: hypothetical protein DWQ10_00645 [Calditrichota bacterium]